MVLPPASPDIPPLQLFAKSRGEAGLPSLRHLLLSACCEKKNAIGGNNTTMPIINDDTLLAIAQHCKRLRSLCLQEAPDDTARQLRHSLRGPISRGGFHACLMLYLV